MSQDSGMYCPYCDRLEHGKSLSKLLNQQSGWVCSGMGHKFPNYIAMMNLNPRKDKLIIREKQPKESTVFPMWIRPEALSGLQQRFPSNFMTTMYALFNALADPGTIVVEAEYTAELQKLGITKGKDIIGLAQANIQLQEQLTAQAEEMKQYKMVAQLMSMMGGGAAAGAVSPLAALLGGGGLQGAGGLQIPQDKPPHNPVLPTISTESDDFAQPVEAGSFSDGSLSRVILPAPPLVQAAEAFKRIPGR
jgi:hypothetical protein